MSNAQCGCGAVRLTLPGPSRLVVACHCVDCQRRTGAPFGVGVFYVADAITIAGNPTEYVRMAASGANVHSYFCPTCGSTVYWKSSNLPSMVGVAVGAMADSDHPAPTRSIFERSQHAWVTMDHPGVEHFQESSLPKSSG